MANATCKTCGSTFEQTTGRGRPRAYCDGCRRVDNRRRSRPKKPVELVDNTCNWCGLAFVGVPSRRYCSDDCARAFRHRPRGACSACGKPIHVSRTSAPRPRCGDCREASLIEHGTPTGYGQHRRRGIPPCDSCRAAWNADCAERQRAARLRGWVRKDRPNKGRTCDECGKALRSNAGRAVDGLTLCKEHRAAKRARDRQRTARRRELERFVRRQAEGVSANPRWAWVQGQCEYCGEQFTRKGAASGYCSSKCRRKDKKTKWITTTRRLALYERDNWTCQLCMEPVDREADHLDPWAPTLDHIEPQSLALIPDHSDANLRTAHRWCNSVRGDGTYHKDFFEVVDEGDSLRVRA